MATAIPREEGRCQTVSVPCTRRAFANPSYHVQALFAQHQGLHYVHTDIDSLSARDNSVAASVTCQDDGCSRLSIKVSCFPNSSQGRCIAAAQALASCYPDKPLILSLTGPLCWPAPSELYGADRSLLLLQDMGFMAPPPC